jgi:hypothetical protein
MIGVAFQDVTKSKLYPAVSLKRPGELVKVNFGQYPFEYNIDDMMKVCSHALFGIIAVRMCIDNLCRVSRRRFKSKSKRPTSHNWSLE